MAAEEIRTAAAVAMHDIRLLAVRKLCQPPRKLEIEIARATKIPHRNRGTPGDFVDPRAQSSSGCWHRLH
jgi:hypothetical protein